MTHAALLTLLHVTTTRRRGRVVYATRLRPCRAWVKAHQSLIAEMAADPSGLVNVRALMDAAMKVGDLTELGFQCWPDLNTGEIIWSHRNGDDHGIKVLVGLVDGAAEHKNAERRGRAMQWELQQGRGHVNGRPQ